MKIKYLDKYNQKINLGDTVITDHYGSFKRGTVGQMRFLEYGEPTILLKEDLTFSMPIPAHVCEVITAEGKMGCAALAFIAKRHLQTTNPVVEAVYSGDGVYSVSVSDTPFGKMNFMMARMIFIEYPIDVISHINRGETGIIRVKPRWEFQPIMVLENAAGYPSAILPQEPRGLKGQCLVIEEDGLLTSEDYNDEMMHAHRVRRLKTPFENHRYHKLMSMILANGYLPYIAARRTKPMRGAFYETLESRQPMTLRRWQTENLVWNIEPEGLYMRVKDGSHFARSENHNQGALFAALKADIEKTEKWRLTRNADYDLKNDMRPILIYSSEGGFERAARFPFAPALPRDAVLFEDFAYPHESLVNRLFTGQTVDFNMVDPY